MVLNYRTSWMIEDVEWLIPKENDQDCDQDRHQDGLERPVFHVQHEDQGCQMVRHIYYSSHFY